LWTPSEPKAPGRTARQTVQGGVLFIHGMAEHRLRYVEVAEALAARGFLVCVYDQRGHGESAPEPTQRRHISPGNDWLSLVDDAAAMLEALRAEVRRTGSGNGGGGSAGSNTGGGSAGPDQQASGMRSLGTEEASQASGTEEASGTEPPLFVVGHSMGSLVARDLLARTPDSTRPDIARLCGGVLIGTAGPGGMKALAGRAIAGALAAVRKPSTPSPFLNAMVFGAYNASVPTPRTDFDWVSSDKGQVDDYVSDPLCGEVMSPHFFRELARGISRVSAGRAFRETPQETAILLMAGTEDPVGEHGRGVEWVAEQYRAAGHANVTLRFYEGARHALLHERDRAVVTEELIDWLDSKATACKSGRHSKE
jgi:alpha-beta hydrolase superfamily lysophospholipase